MKLPILVTALVISVVLAQSASAISYSSSQKVQAVCKDNQVTLSWSFKNTSTSQLFVTVQDVQSKQRSSERSVSSGMSTSGVLDVEKPAIKAGSVRFTLRESSSGRDVDIKTARYTALDCADVRAEPASTETPTSGTQQQDDLPNTGPREAFMVFTALIIGTGSAWYMTQKELQRSLLNR